MQNNLEFESYEYQIFAVCNNPRQRSLLSLCFKTWDGELRTVKTVFGDEEIVLLHGNINRNNRGICGAKMLHAVILGRQKYSLWSVKKCFRGVLFCQTLCELCNVPRFVKSVCFCPSHYARRGPWPRTTEWTASTFQLFTSFIGSLHRSWLTTAALSLGLRVLLALQNFISSSLLVLKDIVYGSALPNTLLKLAGSIRVVVASCSHHAYQCLDWTWMQTSLVPGCLRHNFWTSVYC